MRWDNKFCALWWDNIIVLGELMSEVTDDALVGCYIGYIDICDNTLIVSTTAYPSVSVDKVYFYNL